MAGLSSVGGVAGNLSNVEFAAQYAAQTASLQKDAIEMQGDMAMKLIDSAAVQQTGQHIDFRV